MKIFIKNRFLLPVLIAVLGLILTASAQAQVQWFKRIASNNTSETIDDGASIGMTLDTNANCYVTGWFDGTNDFGGVILTNNNIGGQDIFVGKYNSTGALQWAQQAGGNSANEDVGRGIGVDTNGNVYVTGGFYSPANFGSYNLPGSEGQEFFLAKYNSAGTVQWVQQSVGGNEARSDGVNGTGLAVDGAGNCYVLGFADNGSNIVFGTTILSTPNNGSESTFLVKYDNTGTVKWAELMGGAGEVYATKVAVDASGNVYVRGTFFSTMTIGSSNLVVSPAGSTKNMFIAKFNNSGTLTWVEQPTGGNVDEGGVAVDQTGNVYVTGFFVTNLNFGSSISLTNAASLYYAFVAKYNSSGAIQWARQTTGTNFDLYFDDALDGQGNVYTAGALSSETAVVKYSPTGTIQWAYSASGPPASPAGSLVAKCAVDQAGNCFLAGWYQETNTFGTNVLQPQGLWNYFLAKVAPPTPPTLGIVLSNGIPRLSLASAISSMYSLQLSQNLTMTNSPWQLLPTISSRITLTNSPQFYLDTSVPSSTNRFYRAAPPAL
jgi:hypothetical protein